MNAHILSSINLFDCKTYRNIRLNYNIKLFRVSGMPSISIPLDPPANSKLKDTSVCQSKVCTDVIKGFDCGDEVAYWISEALEVSFLRLIRQSADDKRRINKKSDEKALLSLSNQAQYLLINKATVRWLESKICDPLFTDNTDQLTDRFRGNIIIDAEEELVEREWQRVIIGNHEFKVSSAETCLSYMDKYYWPVPYLTILLVKISHTSNVNFLIIFKAN